MARIGVLSSVALAGLAKLDMDVWVCMLTVKFVLGDLFQFDVCAHCVGRHLSILPSYTSTCCFLSLLQSVL